MAKTIVYHIVVVGCGGTGGFFIKEFGRFMARSRAKILLTMIDGDTVEQHNLDRQSFQDEDIGLPKSTVLAEALVACFGIPQSRVTSYPCYITGVEQLSGIVHNSYHLFLNETTYTSDYLHLPILIGCVDNHAARIVMHNFYMSYSDNIFYFDSANEYSHGEVVFAGRGKTEELAPPRGVVFPEVLSSTEKARTELSCAELNIHEPQHIVTNMLAANLLLSKTCSLVTEKQLPELGVVMFDALQLTSIFRPYDAHTQASPAKQEVKKRGRKRKESTNIAS